MAQVLPKLSAFRFLALLCDWLEEETVVGESQRRCQRKQRQFSQYNLLLNMVAEAAFHSRISLSLHLSAVQLKRNR